MTLKKPSVETLLTEAIELESPEDRARYVEQSCQGDIALKIEVQRLLANHFEAGKFLETATPHFVPPSPPPSASEPIGAKIGHYKLLEQIGEGGMGTVYMAEQKEPLRRMVALKVIKQGMDTQQVVARFEAERQALAMMNHPNIARVLDAGVTESGRPYFVMELVKGTPITEHCDTHKLDTGERLDLFLQVCLAVQHAHQKGIIHRDLKPPNVIVAMHDTTPVVKVIDFGVAKAIGQQLTDHSLFTGFSQIIGTPLYMSPEQAGQSSLDIDTRSDIYSLGVLLYELLTGCTPFETETLKQAGYDEIRRIIREVEPPRPSARISTLKAAALSTIAERRNVEPRKFSQQFRGELDWIVMKALEKDRNRRYQTASGLARDVERYLADEPVEARPASAAYRFKKLLRRNKGSAIAAISLVLGLVITTFLALRLAVRERELAVNQSELVQRERELGQRRQVIQVGISSALAEVVRLRGQAGAEAFTADMLAQAKEQIQRALALAGTGPTDAQSLTQIQQLAAELEQEHRDRKLLAGVEAARQAGAATNVDESRFETETMIPLLREAFADYGLPIAQGNPQEVARQIAGRPQAIREQLLAALEELRTELIPPVGIRLVQNSSNPARIEFVVQPLSEFLKSGDEIVAVGQDRSGQLVDTRRMTPTEVEQLFRGVATSSMRLEVISPGDTESRIHEIQRDPAIAWIGEVIDAADPDPWRRRVREAYELADKTQQKIELEKLANEVDLERQPVSAVSAMSRGLSANRAITLLKWVQQRNPADLWVNCRLAALLADSNPAEAMRFYTAAVSLCPDSVCFRNNLGVVLKKQGKLDEAIAEYREALRQQPSFNMALNNLANALRAQGKLDESIAVYRAALRLKPDDALLHNNLGGHLQNLGKVDEAIAEHREALRIKPDFAIGHNNLGTALKDQGKLEEAIVEFREALRLQPDYLRAHDNLGVALANQGKFDEAIAEHREALRLKSDDFRAHNNLAIVWHRQGKLEEAIAEYREAVRLEPDDVIIRQNLRAALRSQGKLEEAIVESREFLQRQKGNPSDLAAAYKDLGDMLRELARWDEAAQAYRGALEAEHMLLKQNSAVVPVSRIIGLRRNFAAAIVSGSHPDALEPFLREDLAAWQKLESVHADKVGCHEQLFDLQHRLAIWLHQAGQFDEAEDHFSQAIALLEPLTADKRRLLGTVIAYLKNHRFALPVISAEMNPQQLALRQLVARHLESVLAVARQAAQENLKSYPAWDRWNIVAMAHYRERNWEGAEVDARLAAKLAADAPNYLMHIAPLFLLAGKQDEYRELCETLMDGWERWTGNDLGNAAIMCYLDPHPPSDPERLLRLAQQAADKGPPWSRPIPHSYELRVGEYMKVIERLMDEGQGKGPTYPPSQLELAIAYHLAGQHEDARTWLERAQRSLETWSDVYTNQRIAAEVLRQEAERLINGKRAVDVNNETSPKDVSQKQPANTDDE